MSFPTNMGEWLGFIIGVIIIATPLLVVYSINRSMDRLETALKKELGDDYGKPLPRFTIFDIFFDKKTKKDGSLDRRYKENK